ncbi:hypothetical protein [Acaryochloris sp. CCMEE 5410]|uniref:hypothetical protein n=1 Tax=Acaryochloris sp. CCMEE 5410 TaxID=310037 RepID=UPI0002484852|nr:hypothetical protein [Acaryochloris sp. CCMEE 5410]KAI9129598.1 hypothetical protein ON05_033410 [Acaryochloris sp. CCMEE 5410]
MRTLLISLSVSLLICPVAVAVEANQSNQSVEECAQTIEFRPHDRKFIKQLKVVYSQNSYHLIGVEDANHNWWVILKTNPCKVLMMDPFGDHLETFRGVVPDDVVEGMELAAKEYNREFYKKNGY